MTPVIRYPYVPVAVASVHPGVLAWAWTRALLKKAAKNIVEANAATAEVENLICRIVSLLAHICAVGSGRAFHERIGSRIFSKSRHRPVRNRCPKSILAQAARESKPHFRRPAANQRHSLTFYV